MLCKVFVTIHNVSFEREVLGMQDSVPNDSFGCVFSAGLFLSCIPLLQH
jgi:hypothetical protein